MLPIYQQSYLFTYVNSTGYLAIGGDRQTVDDRQPHGERPFDDRQPRHKFRRTSVFCQWVANGQKNRRIWRYIFSAIVEFDDRYFDRDPIVEFGDRHFQNWRSDRRIRRSLFSKSTILTSGDRRDPRVRIVGDRRISCCFYHSSKSTIVIIIGKGGPGTTKMI